MPDARRFEEVLSRCAAGAMPARMAAMHLLIESESSEAARIAVLRALESCAAPAVDRLQEIESLMAQHPHAWSMVHAILEQVSHRAVAGDSVARWAGLFDAAVRVSPEGSVALYSLGSPQLLSAATIEVVAVLSEWQVLGLDRTVLDMGCGIGRLVAALSPLSAAVIGLDISRGMIAEARQRCAGFPNARLLLGSGHDLAGIAAESVDLVVLVDTFPYVLLAEGDLAGRYFAEIGRVLRAGGDVVIFNFSYREDVAADRRDLERLAAPAALSLVRAAERPCASWDAAAYHLSHRPRASTPRQ